MATFACPDDDDHQSSIGFSIRSAVMRIILIIIDIFVYLCVCVCVSDLLLVASIVNVAKPRPQVELQL